MGRIKTKVALVYLVTSESRTHTRHKSSVDPGCSEKPSHRSSAGFHLTNSLYDRSTVRGASTGANRPGPKWPHVRGR